MRTILIAHVRASLTRNLRSMLIGHLVTNLLSSADGGVIRYWLQVDLKGQCGRWTRQTPSKNITSTLFLTLQTNKTKLKFQTHIVQGFTSGNKQKNIKKWHITDDNSYPIGFKRIKLYQTIWNADVWLFCGFRDYSAIVTRQQNAFLLNKSVEV